MKNNTALLWTILTISFTLHVLLDLTQQESAQEVWNHITAGKLIFITIISILPLFLACLNLISNTAPVKWANLITGLLFSFFNTYHLIVHIVNDPAAVHQFIVLSFSIVVSILLIKESFSQKKQKKLDHRQND